MPDNSVECKLILSELASISDKLEDLSKEVADLKLERAKREGARDAHQHAMDEQQKMLARIGAVVVAAFGFIGWIVAGDHWMTIKKLFQ